MLIGYIEHHSKHNGISGWCVHKNKWLRNRNDPIILHIYANDILITKIKPYISRDDVFRGYNVRNSGFKLNLSETLIELIPEGTILSVRDKLGNELPILNKEKIEPVGAATDNGKELQKKLSNGAFVDKWGSLKYPFSKKTQTRRKYILSILETNNIFTELFGFVSFPVYGTLLGMARNGSFIEHDDDVDMSFIVHRDSINDISDDFYFVYDKLIENGFSVKLVNTGQFFLKPKGNELPGVDIFISWYTSSKEFYTYFGVGGPLEDRPTFCRRELENEMVLTPDRYEQILELTYGKDWRIPDPHFQWAIRPSIREIMSSLEAAGRKKMLERI